MILLKNSFFTLISIHFVVFDGVFAFDNKKFDIQPYLTSECITKLCDGTFIDLSHLQENNINITELEIMRFSSNLKKLKISWNKFNCSHLTKFIHCQSINIEVQSNVSVNAVASDNEIVNYRELTNSTEIYGIIWIILNLLCVSILE